MSEQDAVAVTAISQLIACERESRDMGFWQRMLDCFHPDALIDISWIRGNAREFVEGSKDMAARGMLAKHRLGPVLVDLHGERAVATMSGIIDIPTELEGKAFNLSAHSLFLYSAEKREGQWRLSGFEAIYRRDELIPVIPGQSVELPEELLAGFRASYRYLSYSLHLKGYEVNMELPGEDRPDSVRAIYARLYDWLGKPVPA